MDTDKRLDSTPYGFTPREGMKILFPLGIGACFLHKYYGLDKVSEAVSNTFGLNGITAKIPVSLDYTTVACVGVGLMIVSKLPVNKKWKFVAAALSIGLNLSLIPKVSNLSGLSGLLGLKDTAPKGIPPEVGAMMLTGALAVGGYMLYKYNASATEEKKSDKPPNQRKLENIPSKSLVEEPSNHSSVRR